MNIDIQSYIDALQSTQFSQELVNQGLEMAQERKEATLPLSELGLGEGIKIFGEQAFTFLKQQGTQVIKDALRSKMKDAGIDDDTINSTLEGDLSLDNITSKVGSLISKAKSTAQDLVSQAQSKVEGTVSDLQSQAQDIASEVQSQAEDLVGQVQSQAQDLVGQVQSQAEDIVGQVQSQVGGLRQTLTDSLDNLDTTVRSNIIDAQGIQDDLVSQSLQQYNSIIRSGQSSLVETETGTSNILSRISNFFQPQTIQPQDIEMVNFADVAPEISSSIAPEISSSIAPTISDLVGASSNILSGVSETVSSAISGATSAVSGATSAISGVTGATTGAIEGATGALEGLGAGLDFSGALAPIGAILGIIGGIVGIVEGDKPAQEQLPILNPSSQFL
jgi:cell division septum initiation protein DivIVA